MKREGASMLDTEAILFTFLELGNFVLRRFRRMFGSCQVQARIAVLVKQMAAAIRYIHSMGMVHRDIKLLGQRRQRW